MTIVPFPASATTTDVDEARQWVTDAFCSHTLRPRSGSGVRMTFRAARFGPLGMCHLDYGGAVSINPVPLGGFFLVQMPMAGRAEITLGDQTITSTPAVASVLSPDERVAMHWGEGNPQRIVYLARDAVERQLRHMLGRPLSAPLRFGLGMDFSRPAAAAWRSTAVYVGGEIAANSPFLNEPQVMRRWQELLIGQLLVAQPHNYSEALEHPLPATGRAVQAACTFVHDHLGSGIGPSDMAAAAGVGLRALQAVFERELSMSPSAYLREARLSEARRRLLAADPSQGSVTEVAALVGWSHLGRFAVEYRSRFGEKPSATLARAQR